jgi:hypothetical protein
MIIQSKRKFYELWEAGVLGNRTKIFHTLEEAFADGAPKIGFREIGKTGGGAWILITMKDTDVHGDRALFEHRVKIVFDNWKMLGRTFIMDNAVPNDKSTMQGEICRTYRGLESFLAVGRGLPPMRITMAQGLHQARGGAATNVLLDRYMDASSRDDLRDLLDLYPDSAIEFTCFSVNVGNLRARNTIFWEVRNY